MTGKSDNELIYELQHGRNHALDEIISRWEGPIKSYIYRLVQDTEWVDELSQETFVKVYLNASKFDLNRKFSPWIYTIASNLCKNLLRWKKRRPQIAQSIDETIEHPEKDQSVLNDPSSKSPAAVAVQTEESLQVRKAISELPENMRIAIVLYYYQKMSYDEISEVLKCSVRGVETRLYRAKIQLKRKINLTAV